MAALERRLLLLAASIAGCASSSTGADVPIADAIADLGSDSSSVNVGRCGQAVYDCLCACDGGCVTSCLAMSNDCLTCVNDGVSSCCPTESPAYNHCAGEATAPSDGGTPACASSDYQCVARVCQAEAAALQDCLATTRCHDAMSLCTGTWPATCGR